MDLNKHLSLDTIVESNNLVSQMNEDDVKNLGERILRDYQSDEDSRSAWRERYAEALKRVMQYMDRKTFPWDGASNVKFPLLTTAALSYHARAYPALVKGTRPVQCRVVGDDPDGKKQERAERVSKHMSFQILEEDEGWEEEFDKTLMVQAIMGCAFRKCYYDSNLGHNVVELVLPTDLVVNYHAHSLEKAARVTHRIPMSHNDIQMRIRQGQYCELESEGDEGDRVAPMPNQGAVAYAQDEIRGEQPPPPDEDTPRTILEQHFWLDLDGDGYREPYIGTVTEEDGKLLRLIARFEKTSVMRTDDDKIYRITPERYFTKVPFIPAPDGSIYDMGFGMLLGATSEVIDTLINQLTDAGTMSNTGGGFLARGVRIRGGEYSFRPNEWKRTDSSAADMKDGIVPLPVREPSAVLFQLLGLMIEWGSKIGMATDALTGENPGQNQKVGTTEAVIEQGETVFNGIYKRTYRALKGEFRLLYRLNYLNPPPTGEFNYTGENGDGGSASWKDYLPTDKGIVPAADPTIASPKKNLQRWMTVRQLAGQRPGYNMYEIDKQILSVLEIPMIDTILPKPGSQGAPQVPPPVQVQVQQIKAQQDDKKQQSRLAEHREKLMIQQRESEAKILMMQAQAALYSKQAGLAENDLIGQLMDQELSLQKQHQDALQSAIDNTNQLIQAAGEQNGGPNAGGVAGVGQPAGNGGVPQIPGGAGA